MKVILFSASPNTDGLTAACTDAVMRGVQDAGGEAVEVRLNDLEVGSCQACERGWGTCLEEHTCKVLDDFQALHENACEADALALVSPVYWGEMSESAKAFTDRLRRGLGEHGRLPLQCHLVGEKIALFGIVTTTTR